MIKTILRILLVAGLLAYMAVALAFTARLDSARLCRGMEVVLDTDSTQNFVRTGEIERELGSYFAGASGKLLSEIPLDSIEALLDRLDKIERAEAVILTNDSVRVSVCPLVPIVRIFDGSESYYINRTGKRIMADARYHTNVPVVRGPFTEKGIDPMKLLPLVDWLDTHHDWESLIGLIDVHDLENIYLIPDIRGQIIKLGSVDNLDDKFDRIDRFYRRVLPYKGWNYYDTIAVKWAGQVVATRCDKRRTDIVLPVDTLPQSAYDEAVPIIGVP